jgi:hypothetical protein
MSIANQHAIFKSRDILVKMAKHNQTHIQKYNVKDVLHIICEGDSDEIW